MERMGEESDRRMKEIQEQTRISEENREAFHSQVLAELRRIGDELKRIADRRQ
jgi:hypothetical protein